MACEVQTESMNVLGASVLAALHELCTYIEFSKCDIQMAEW